MAPASLYEACIAATLVSLQALAERDTASDARTHNSDNPNVDAMISGLIFCASEGT
jgi:hypothetical protein